MTLLQGRTATVTGASAGLGRRFAQVLADQGASVVMVARRTEELEALSREIAGRGGRALVHPADLANASAIKPLYDAAEESFGTVDTAQKPSRIVNLSSVGAFHYTQRSAAALYCAAKAGIVRMTETLAIEGAHHGINVKAIAPGMFESEMTKGYIAEVGDRVRKSFPRRRIGLPTDLDSSLLYLSIRLRTSSPAPASWWTTLKPLLKNYWH